MDRLGHDSRRRSRVDKGLLPPPESDLGLAIYPIRSGPPVPSVSANPSPSMHLSRQSASHPTGLPPLDPQTGSKIVQDWLDLLSYPIQVNSLDGKGNLFSLSLP